VPSIPGSHPDVPVSRAQQQVNLTNFLVTRYTSALTLQVLGNGKGVIAVVVSILIFHNPWTMNSMGAPPVQSTGLSTQSLSGLAACHSSRLQAAGTAACRWSPLELLKRLMIRACC